MIYQYAPTRSGQVAEDFIGDFTGYLQADAFSGYDRFENNPKIRLMGCWSHARRKFFDVVKAKKKIRSKSKNPKSLADEALAFISELYGIEKKNRLGKKEMDRLQIFSASPGAGRCRIGQFQEMAG